MFSYKEVLYPAALTIEEYLRKLQDVTYKGEKKKEYKERYIGGAHS